MTEPTVSPATPAGPTTRPVLAGFPAYKPGRSPEQVASSFGLERVVKLASNENAYGPLPGVLEKAAAAAGLMNRYPDNASTALRATLGDRLDVDPARLTIGCGSVGLCQQLVQITCDAGADVVYAWRSFEAYPIFVAVAGARSVLVPLRDETYDLEAMAAALTPATRLVFVCNPNNPTGTVVGRAELERFLDAVPRDVVVVYDEAYREFVRDESVPDGLELAEGRPNVVVLRTFSKAYGLAGMRVGYAVSTPEIAEALTKTCVPFAVSTVAQAAAIESLSDASLRLLDDRVDEVVAERARVSEKLRGMGVELPASQANFVWLPLRDAAVPFAEECERRGVLVRPFAGDGVRVTIGAPDENDLFLSVVEPALAAST